MNTNRREFLRTTGLLTAGLLAPSSLLAQGTKAKPNVLFIAVDDLRPQLGCYGQSQIHSPNIDRLAREGFLFERAYCQQAICMASRASLLSGYRPDKGGITRCGPLFSCVPDALTLNQHFLNNGYEAISMGKIYHHASDYEKGWSAKNFQPRGKWESLFYLNKESIRQARAYKTLYPKGKYKGVGPAFESADVPDNAYPDGLLAEHAIQELNRLKDKPFFLAVGFRKPHLPFNSPKKYWDLYREDEIELPKNNFHPKNAPTPAVPDWVELRVFQGIPKEGDMPDDLKRQVIHGYYACVSYVDAMIGKVLAELDRLKLRDNTIIVLWGDHGWKLGEHSMWTKHTNFELDTRVPMILRAPGVGKPGTRIAALTEYVDIYPTLCELCGLTQPPHLEGTSMVPLLKEPGRPWKKAAFSQFPRGKIMGYSMRTDRYRYTEWRDTAGANPTERELYDHETDPDENINVAGDPANRKLVESLAQTMQEGYKAARPRSAEPER